MGLHSGFTLIGDITEDTAGTRRIGREYIDKLDHKLYRARELASVGMTNVTLIDMPPGGLGDVLKFPHGYNGQTNVLLRCMNTPIKVDLYWVNLSTNSGNVVWQLNFAGWSVGNTYIAWMAYTSATVAANSQYVLTKTTFTLDDPSLVEGGILQLQIIRKGTDSSDTLNGDVGLIAIDVYKG